MAGDGEDGSSGESSRVRSIGGEGMIDDVEGREMVTMSDRCGGKITFPEMLQ